MRVLRAETMGFCFGVRDALDAARSEPAPGSTTIHGELVHNEAVLDELRHAGFAMSAEGPARPVPDTRRVLVTAHGVSDRERARLAAAGKEIVDTTCPLVAHAHRTALRLAAECDHVVVLGKPGHVEVTGLTEDLPSHDVVSTSGDVRHYGVARLGVLCQTTFPVARAAEIRRAIEARNAGADVRFADTICEPTKQRMRALEALLGRVDVVVVVGGARSNNTKELVRLCEARSVATVHVQGASDLDPRCFAGVRVAGLTAGTSTRDDTIDAVYEALAAMDTGA